MGGALVVDDGVDEGGDGVRVITVIYDVVMIIHICPLVNKEFFGWVGIAINVVEYGMLKYFCPEMAFLNRMAVCLITIIVIALTVALYIIFW